MKKLQVVRVSGVPSNLRCGRFEILAIDGFEVRPRRSFEIGSGEGHGAVLKVVCDGGVGGGSDNAGHASASDRAFTSFSHRARRVPIASTFDTHR